MFGRLIRLSRDGAQQRLVARLYVELVEQARRPAFYEACGVPDTVWGRFDMVVLHAFLVFRRLAREGTRHAAFSQALFDHMFADIDQNLRELGVGDLGVGKKVAHMAESFYGRAAVYEAGLAGESALEPALRRNLYAGTDPGEEQLAMMAGYLRREAAALDALPADALLAGGFRFGPPPGEEDATR